MLARGDQDIAGMVTGPGFFNGSTPRASASSFIASLAHSKPGWHDTMWIMVRKDLWDAGAIKTYADLKGRTIELGPRGSPIYLFSSQAILLGNLGAKDVTTTERLRGHRRAAAVQEQGHGRHFLVEPLVGRVEAEGLAVKWKPAYEVMPWFQESFLAANPKFLTEKREVEASFLATYLIGREGGDGRRRNGCRTRLQAEMVRPCVGVIEDPGPAAYVAPMGLIDMASIERS